MSVQIVCEDEYFEYLLKDPSYMVKGIFWCGDSNVTTLTLDSQWKLRQNKEKIGWEQAKAKQNYTTLGEWKGAFLGLSK